MSEVFQAVAAYERAHNDERAAWRAFDEAAALAVEETGGRFEISFGVGVVWHPPEGALDSTTNGWLVSHRQCPEQVRKAASDFGLAAVADAVEEVREDWCRTSEAMFRAQCVSPADKIEKLRALLLIEPEHFLGATEEIWTAIDGLLAGVERDARPAIAA